MVRLFLAHSSVDKEFVRRLAGDLKLLGHDAWVDEDEILVGDSIPAKIAEAIARSDYLVPVFSKDALKSGWFQNEWESKYWEQVNEQQVRVLPVRVDRCELPQLLRAKKYADFERSYGVGIVELTRAIDRMVEPTPLTRGSEFLDALVDTSIESLCRAVSLPGSPSQPKIRVFVFRIEGEELVCRYHWAADPVSEKVGHTRFAINDDTAKEVAVVRAVLDRRTCRTQVRPLSDSGSMASTGSPEISGSPSFAGDVDETLSYVLASPIFGGDGAVWGTVDFDTATDTGTALLSTEAAASAILQIARHLAIVLPGGGE